MINLTTNKCYKTEDTVAVLRRIGEDCLIFRHSECGPLLKIVIYCVFELSCDLQGPGDLWLRCRLIGQSQANSYTQLTIQYVLALRQG